VLGTSAEDLRARIRLCRAGVAKPCWNGSPYAPVPVARGADPATALQIMERREDFPGVTAELSAVREYPRPLGANAAHELGYLGPVTDAELMGLYAHADVFVHAGEVELEGMAVLEALGAGLPPLVAASTESAASQFAPSPSFLFRRGDAGDLVARLDALLDEPRALRAGSEHACATAQHYEFASCVEDLLHAFETTIELAEC
jgi:glycosyltransferase involved in cell wall biosynthesis